MKGREDTRMALELEQTVVFSISRGPSEMGNVCRSQTFPAPLCVLCGRLGEVGEPFKSIRSAGALSQA